MKPWQKQAAERPAQLREALQQEQQKTAALTQEAKAAQADPERRALEDAQAHAAALASELVGTRREIESKTAQSQKAVDEAVARRPPPNCEKPCSRSKRRPPP